MLGSSCSGHSIPSNDKIIGIVNSDFHMYVTAKNEPGERYLAWAVFC